MSQSLLNLREKVIISDEEVYEYFEKEESVRNWIERALDIPLKGDIIDCLHNGIVLCYLMRKLDESSIPRIQEQTNLQAKLLENIRFFLDAVHDYGVPKHKLFYESDLWDKSNRVRIIECIEELAKQSEIKGFEPKLIKKNLDEKKRSKINKLLFEKVRELLSNLPKSPYKTIGGGTLRKEAPGLIKRKLQLLHGQSDFPEFERKCKKIQALIRTRLMKKEYLDRVKKHAMRERIVKELLETETSYVNHLRICIDEYLVPLRDGTWNKKLKLDRQEIKALFSDIELILNFNITLRNEIEKRIQTWSPSHIISDIFLSIMSFLKVYSNYVATFGHSVSTYENLKKNNKLFTPFIEEVRVKKSNGLDLPALLIMPVQRVPRYYLLLENFLKNTWKDHRDYEDLEKVVNGLKEISSYLNEKKRDYENMQELLNIQDMYINGPNLCLNGRKFINRYNFYDPKKKVDTLIFLCNDIIVVTKYNKKLSSYEYKSDYTIKDISIKKVGEITYDILFKNVVILTVHSKSKSGEAFTNDLNECKSQLSNDDSSDDDDDDISPEELLRLREIEKRKLKKAIEEEKKSSNRVLVRTATSLIKMRAIIQEQIDVIEETKVKGGGIKVSISKENLAVELDALNEEISKAKSSLKPEELKEIQKEEEKIELKKKKKKRRIFRFFLRSSNKKKQQLKLEQQQQNKNNMISSDNNNQQQQQSNKAKRLSFHSVNRIEYEKDDDNDNNNIIGGRKRALTLSSKK